MPAAFATLGAPFPYFICKGGITVKSTFFRKILEETTVETGVSFNDTLFRLRAQRGICRSEHSSGERYVFVCNKKGKFFVANSTEDINNDISDRRYQHGNPYVCGKIISEEGKTKVKVYCVYNKILAFLLCSTLIFTIIYALFIIFLLPSISASFSLKELLLLMLAPAAVIISDVRYFNTQKNSSYDLEKMKSEVMARIDAVKRWED